MTRCGPWQKKVLYGAEWTENWNLLGGLQCETVPSGVNGPLKEKKEYMIYLYKAFCMPLRYRRKRFLLTLI